MSMWDNVNLNEDWYQPPPTSRAEYAFRARIEPLRGGQGWLGAQMRERDRIVREAIEAQADLQVGLGILRLELHMVDSDTVNGINLTYAEQCLANSLEKLRALLASLGNSMAS